jgi:hypothetical protein
LSLDWASSFFVDQPSDIVRPRRRLYKIAVDSELQAPVKGRPTSVSIDAWNEEMPDQLGTSSPAAAEPYPRAEVQTSYVLDGVHSRRNHDKTDNTLLHDARYGFLSVLSQSMSGLSSITSDGRPGTPGVRPGLRT